MTEINWADGGRTYGTVKYPGDESLVVLFYWKSIIDHEKSLQQGTPIYKNQEYVTIFRPGEQMNKIDRPVENQDKFRFDRQWQNFVNKKTQVPEGTPVDVLFPNLPAVADNLRSQGVYTIQQLAQLTAHAIDTIGMGAQEWVNRAVSYLDNAKSGKEVLKLHNENRALKAEAERQAGYVKELSAKVDMLMRAKLDPSSLTGPNVNPATGHPNPPHVEGYDAQEARINSGHVTGELFKNSKRK